MRTLRKILLSILMALSGYLLLDYARAIYTFYEPGHGLSVFHVFSVSAYRPWPGSEAKSGLSLHLASDPPEGTVSLFRFPSWSLALVAAGVLIYAGYILLVRREKHVA